MTPESLKKIRTLVDQIVADLGKVGAFDSYDNGVAMLLAALRTGVIPPAWLHRLAGRVYPINEPNSVQPEDLEKFLVSFGNQEEALSQLANLPEELAPQIEATFREFRTQVMPAIRQALLATAKQLPYRRAGGRPKTMPSPEERKQICKEIADLVQHIGIGVAQKRIAERRGLTLRMIQRIWQERTQNNQPEQLN